MFSRYGRDRLIEVANRYLNEELTAFKLDGALSEIGTKTKDKTVEQVVQLLWYHYDGVQDHKVVASKEEWDYFQRLLLILKSDAEIVQETGERKWTARQAVAAVCLALFGLAVAKTGFGYHLLVVTMPLGVVSMLLSHWRSRDNARRLHDQTALMPFRTVSDLQSRQIARLQAAMLNALCTEDGGIANCRAMARRRVRRPCSGLQLAWRCTRRASPCWRRRQRLPARIPAAACAGHPPRSAAHPWTPTR